MTRVFIVAAYPTLRAGLASLLQSDATIELAGDAANVDEASLLMSVARPDVVLWEDGGPTAPGELTHLLDILEEASSALVWLGSAAEMETVLRRPLRGLAMLTRESSPQELTNAIRAAAAGLIVFDRARLPQELPSTPTIDSDLTPREREILQLLAQGLPNKTIAHKLGISQHTVKFHVASLLAKLGAASRTEAVTIGARRGLVLL